MKKNRVAMAIAAHPDDIEFMMAGTLLLFRLSAVRPRSAIFRKRG